MSDTQQQQQLQQPERRRVPLTAVPVGDNENLALNLMVSFLGLAQSRGAFNLDEASKIVECMRVFQKDTTLEQSEPHNVVLETVEEEEATE